MLARLTAKLGAIIASVKQIEQKQIGPALLAKPSASSLRSAATTVLAPAWRASMRVIPSPNEDDSSQFQSTGDVIQHGKRGGLLCRHRWRSDLITMPLA